MFALLRIRFATKTLQNLSILVDAPGDKNFDTKKICVNLQKEKEKSVTKNDSSARVLGWYCLEKAWNTPVFPQRLAITKFQVDKAPGCPHSKHALFREPRRARLTSAGAQTPKSKNVKGQKQPPSAHN
jgi:hypothetical protein